MQFKKPDLKVIKISCAVIFSIIIFLLALGLYRTFTFEKVSKAVPQKSAPKIKANKDAVEHLSKAIQLTTISNSKYEDTDFIQFENFLDFLHTTYPKIFKKLDYTPINDYGILLVWRARENNNLLPLLITGHYDTVGVDSSILKAWSHEPFQGTVDGGKIWGRGALDDKGSFMAIIEAINALIEEGFVPKTDIYFAFGHDEEVGGIMGALKIAQHLAKQGIKFEYVLDEGGRVETEGDSETAYIGISEKGRYGVNIVVKSEGGHASRPLKTSSVTKLAQVIQALHKNQMKQKLTPDVEEYYRATFSKQNFATKFLIANANVLRPLLLKHLANDPVGNAYTRTTTALTVLKGSEATNVIPEYASVTGDFRLLPETSVEDVEKHIKNTLKKGARGVDYELEVFFNEPPSKVSPTKNVAFKKLSKEITRLFPEAQIVPYMVPGGTDARHYEIVSDSIYRFAPLKVTSKEYGLMHNIDEYISIENYLRAIMFYKNLITNFQN